MLEDAAGTGTKDSIFKNSRLMLHEIVDGEDDDWVNIDHFDNIPEDVQEKETGDKAETNDNGILQPNQLLQVVKITKCKMK